MTRRRQSMLRWSDADLARSVENGWITLWSGERSLRHYRLHPTLDGLHHNSAGRSIRQGQPLQLRLENPVLRRLVFVPGNRFPFGSTMGRPAGALWAADDDLQSVQPLESRRTVVNACDGRSIRIASSRAKPPSRCRRLGAGRLSECDIRGARECGRPPACGPTPLPWP